VQRFSKRVAKNQMGRSPKAPKDARKTYTICVGGLSRSRGGVGSVERSPETSASGGVHSLGGVLAVVQRRAIASLVVRLASV
jgi:hypothetical protein